jgi:asparagine synthase (glutamine-hydrolysing)
LGGFSASPLLGRIVRKGLSTIPGILPSPKYAGLLEYGGTLEGAYLLRRALFMPWEICALMDSEMAAAGLEELHTIASMRAITDGIGSERLAISALEMQQYMKNQLLRDADWAGMAHSIEIRTPFVDMTLLEQFVEMPSLTPAQEKWSVARAVAPNLPETVLSRPKTGFSVPIHQWLNPDAGRTTSNHREWAQVLYQTFTKS